MANHFEVHQTIKRIFKLKGHSVIPWSSRRGYDRRHLAQVFAEVGYTKGAEIGVRRGRFTMMCCKANPNLHMLCVDPWMAYATYTQERQDGIYKQAVNNLKSFNTTIIRKTSMDAVKEVKDGSLDFIFIDGNHQFDFVMMDLICWAPKVRSGGIVSLHDYYPLRAGGVVQAVNAYTHCHCINPWYATKELEPTAFWVQP